MKQLIMTTSLLITPALWASPLELHCTINKKPVTLVVESLVGSGCQSTSYKVMNGQLNSRYNVKLCGGTQASGNVEVSTNRNEWIEVENFSTEENCYLFRPIETNPNGNCTRFSHQC